MVRCFAKEKYFRETYRRGLMKKSKFIDYRVSIPDDRANDRGDFAVIIVTNSIGQSYSNCSIVTCRLFN